MKKYSFIFILLALASMLIGQNAYYLNEIFTSNDWSTPAGWTWTEGMWLEQDFANSSNLVLASPINQWTFSNEATTPVVGPIVTGTVFEFEYRAILNQTEGFELNPNNYIKISVGDDEILRINSGEPTIDWIVKTVNLDAYLGEFIQFKMYIATEDESGFKVEFNYVSVYYPAVEKDLFAHSVAGFTMPSVDLPTTNTVRVVNMGTLPAIDYTVALLICNGGEDLDELLGSTPGVELAPGESIDIVVSWTPKTAGLTNLYGRVDYDGDTIPNNATDHYVVNVHPDDVVISYVGDETNTRFAPDLLSSSPSTVIQNIYLAEDIALSGEIFEFGYYFRSYGDIESLPIKIYFAVTDKEIFDENAPDWVQLEDFTLVYEGNFAAPVAGDQFVFFSLETPFEYKPEDGNLVVMVFKPFGGQTYGWQNGFLVTERYYNGLRTYDWDNDIDLNNLPTDWSAQITNDFTNLVLKFIYDGTSEEEIVIINSGNVLHPNYPNPFNPSTTISFETVKDGNVQIDIYNVRGQRINTLLNDNLKSGLHIIEWNGKDDNGSNVASGIYFYRLRTEEETIVRRMVMMK